MKLFYLFILCAVIESNAQTIKVRLFSNRQVEAVNISYLCDDYTVIVDGIEVVTDGKVSIRVSNNQLSFVYNNEIIKSDIILIRQLKQGVNFKISTNLQPNYNSTLEGDAVISCNNKEVVFTLNVELNAYLSGVVEAEAGGCSQIEMLKVQAILARSYAIANLNRHFAEGYNLCADQHCQVYKGKAKWNRLADSAVLLTKNLILTDSNSKAIAALYHSNCGGKTGNIEELWNSSVPFFKQVEDPHCASGQHHSWQQLMDRNNWNRFVYTYTRDSSFLLPHHDIITEVYCHDDRPAYIFHGNNYISTALIRNHFNLKSAWFNLFACKDQLLLIGRGFGHGIGLCQEGAMKMAANGKNHIEILNFYYRNFHLVDAPISAIVKTKMPN